MLQTASTCLVVINTANRGKLDDISTYKSRRLITAITLLLDGDINMISALASGMDEFASIIHNGDDIFLMMAT